MGVGELETEIQFDNLEEMKSKMEEFGINFKEGLYKSLQRTANVVEKDLKAVTGFTDRTGKLRRSFYAEALWNPLSIIFGSLDPKAIFVAYAHGTWQGSWWEKFKRYIIPIIQERTKNAIERLVNKFNKEKD